MGNVVAGPLREGHFLTTRGSGSQYGPVFRTKAYNNSVYLTGSEAYAIQCSNGCNSSILSMRNNIVWSADRIGHADGSFDEGDNIYWTPGGVDKLRFPISSSSMKANPMWISPDGSNFRLQSGSPAVNEASARALNLGYRQSRICRTPLPRASTPTGSPGSVIRRCHAR